MSPDGTTFEPTSSGETGTELAALVASLVYSLRAQGFTADPRQAIAAEILLISLRQKWHEPDFDLAAYLGPVFCRSAEEQRRFREIASALPLLKGNDTAEPEGEPAISGPASILDEHQVRRRQPWRLIPVMAAICLLIGGTICFLMNPQSSREVGRPVVQEPKLPESESDPKGKVTESALPVNASAPAKLLSYHRIMLREPLANPSGWSWAWASLPLVGLIGWFLQHRGKRPRLRRESTDLPEAFREVRLPGGPREALSRLRVRELSRSLRIRQRVASRELHTDLTIARTIENGGLPTLVFESLVEPRYLVLVDRTGSNDHFGQLSEELLRTLQLGNVDFNTFEFDGNPTYCNLPPSQRRASGRFRFRLTEILDNQPDRPLLILSDGAGFLDPFTEAPPEWFNWVADHPRVLVTPANDKFDWTPLEQKLRRHGFQVVPMTPTGIPEVASVLAGLESTSRSIKRPSLPFETEPDRCLSLFKPPVDFIQSLLEQLRDHLGTDGFLWLASLAAYPELHWGLTLRFGASLIPDEERWEILLPRLSRLIWLRQGFMPDWLRGALLGAIPPKEEARVRQLLMEFLSIGRTQAQAQAQAQAASQTGDDPRDIPLRIVVDQQLGIWRRIIQWWKNMRTLQTSSVETRWDRIKAWWNSRGRPRKSETKGRYDYVYLRFLSGRGPTWLTPYVPEKLMRMLFPGGAWILGPSVWFATALFAAASVLTFFGAEKIRARGFQVQSMEVTHNGERVVTRHRDGEIRLWNNDWPVLDLKGHTDRVNSVAFAPDGKRIVSGSLDKTIMVWDAVSGQESLTLSGHFDGVLSVAFAPDGRIVSGSLDKTIMVWDAVSGQSLRTLKGHTGHVYSAAFSPDGKWIVSASQDKTIKVWNAESGQEIHTLMGHSNSVSSVAFSKDGKQIVSGSDDTTIKVWDAESGQERLTLKGHKGYVVSAAFSADGKRIVSGSWDETLKVWNLETVQEMLTLKGHVGHVVSATFSPDGKLIVSGGTDKTLKVWDAESGQERLMLKGHSDTVYSVAFSPDGKQIASGSWDKTARIWDSMTENYDWDLSSGSQYVGMSADGHRWAEKASSGEVEVYEFSKSEPVFRTDTATTGDVTLLSADGNRLAVARAGTVTLSSVVSSNLARLVSSGTDSATSSSGTVETISRAGTLRSGRIRPASGDVSSLLNFFPSNVDPPGDFDKLREGDAVEYRAEPGSLEATSVRLMGERAQVISTTKLAQPIDGVWGSDGGAVFWDAEGNLCIFSSLSSTAFDISIPVGLQGYAQSNNQRYLIFWGQAGSPALVDTQSFVATKIQGPLQLVQGATFCTRSDRFFMWDKSGSGTIVDFVSKSAGTEGFIDITFQRGFEGNLPIRSAGLSQSGNVLHVLTDNNQLSFYWLTKPEILDVIEESQQVDSAFLTVQGIVKQVVQGDGDTLAVVFEDGSVRFWDAQFGVALSDPLPTSGNVTLAAFGKSSLSQESPSGSTGGLIQVPPEAQQADVKSQTVQEPPLKGALGKGQSPGADNFPSPAEPDTRQALSLITEEGNIEVWELNNSGRGVALLISAAGKDGGSQAAKELADVLQAGFGFEVTFLEEPTKQQVQEEWNRLRTTLSPNDRFVMVMQGSSTKVDGNYFFGPGLSADELISVTEIRQFMDSTRASQSILIAASSYTGLLKGDPAHPPAVKSSGKSILVMTASDSDDQSVVKDEWDKLLSPITQALGSGEPPFNGNFDAESLWKKVQSYDTTAPNSLPEFPQQVVGSIQFGPLIGSQHTNGARFYFPAPRPTEISDSAVGPSATKAEPAKDDPRPPGESAPVAPTQPELGTKN